MEDLAFAGVGISHAAFGGAAIGIYFGWNPYLISFLYSLIVASIISVSGNIRNLKENTLIGVFFSFSMALGYILITLSRSYTDAWGYLFGSIYTLSSEDLYLIFPISFIASLWFFIFKKHYALIGFNEELALSYGIPVGFMRFALLLLLTADIIISMKLAGIILVNSLLVIPGAIGKLFGGSFKGFIIITLTSGFFLTLVGFITSIKFDLPPGALISILMVLALFLSLAFKKVTS